MMDDYDFDEIVGDSNAGAYKRTEIRQGPPLEYVSGKLEESLEHLHGAIRSIEQALPASDIKERILFAGTCAFEQEVVAFLALHNLLRGANDTGLAKRLLSLSSDEFELWLSDARAEGSVTG